MVLYWIDHWPNYSACNKFAIINAITSYLHTNVIHIGQMKMPHTMVYLFIEVIIKFLFNIVLFACVCQQQIQKFKDKNSWMWPFLEHDQFSSTLTCFSCFSNNSAKWILYIVHLFFNLTFGGWKVFFALTVINIIHDSSELMLFFNDVTLLSLKLSLLLFMLQHVVLQW